MTGIDLFAGRLLQPFDDVHLGGDRYVADADGRDIGGVFAQCLGDQPGRVGEIDQQRILFRQLTHVGGDLQDHRDGPQGLCHAAHAGRLLTDQPMAQTEIFIPAAGFHLADAQLCGHVGSACNSLALVGGQEYLERRAFCLDHALGKPTNDL